MKNLNEEEERLINSLSEADPLSKEYGIGLDNLQKMKDTALVSVDSVKLLLCNFYRAHWF